jgi:uncharacterized protein (DUF302 family)
MMTPSAFSVQPFEAKRLQYASPRSFDDILQTFQEVVGTTDGAAVLQGTSESVRTREEYEKLVQSHVGESGFMLFFQLDYGRWLPLFGVQRRVMRLIFGNPLLAITMLQHDVTAGLFVPVEIVVVENESRDGAAVIYDLPSAQMKIENNPALLAAAQELDRKLQVVVSRVTGVEPSHEKSGSLSPA